MTWAEVWDGVYRAIKKRVILLNSFWKTIFYCLSKSINSMFIIETLKQQ